MPTRRRYRLSNNRGGRRCQSKLHGSRCQRVARMVSNIRCMTAPTPYLHFPGTAREALTFYGDIFGCAVQLHTFAEFNRTDGPADAIAHGYLIGGPVVLFAADV